ncbi:PPE domain-containing protein [Mycobacteroides salmoniphilum]|uniref:PPE family protein n=1 Tax=Mycobacteroides salmoniphilum TaxID=404941 RepID=A0A4R8SZY7_9MYCO|nr:PPE domain-containing protein [Mycobacteroides salmoniphilum]TEA09172.1 PPE family protein [Mycobacteroides salmoniphilum]
MRFDPAPLQATAAALNAVSAPNASTPALPPSQHPVSAQAVAQLNAHATNVAALLEHAAQLAARGSATYLVSAHDLVQADLDGSHLVGNAYDGYKSAFAALKSFNPFTSDDGPTAATNAPAAASAGAAPPPIPPHPPAPVELPHPPDPQAVPGPAEAAAAALAAGDQGASLESMATAWRAIAAQLRDHQSSLTSAAGGLESGWQGESSTAAVARLRPFAAWFGDGAAQAAESVAQHADRLYQAHIDAVNEHPTETELAQLRQNYNTEMAAAASGNVAAAGRAATYRQELSKAQATSNEVVSSYASHSAIPMAIPQPVPSPVTPGSQREVQGDKPKDGRGGPIKPDDPKDKPTTGGEHPDSDHESLHEFKPSDKANPAASGQPASAPPTKPDAGTPRPHAVDPAAAGMDDPAAMAPPSPLISTLGQQVGQAAQAAPGGGQPPSAPPMPQMSPPQSPQIPPMSPPQSPPQGASPQSPQNPSLSPSSTGGGGVPPIGMSGGGGGAGGGGAGGPLGSVSPASALPANNAPTAPGGPTTGVTAGMGMGPGGMMPHGANQGSGKQNDRNPGTSPDTPIYIEDREHTNAFVDGTVGPPPPPEIKEQQQ